MNSKNYRFVGGPLDGSIRNIKEEEATATVSVWEEGSNRNFVYLLISKKYTGSQQEGLEVFEDFYTLLPIRSSAWDGLRNHE